MNPPHANLVMQEIWSRSTGKYIFLPSRDTNGKWNEKDAISIFGFSNPGFSSAQDNYFTPLLFNEPQRRKAYVGNPGVIFADLDSEEAGERAVEFAVPSVLIKSSAGHYHGYWFLDHPVNAVNWESHARGFSQLVGADPGGWDITQVLRVPDTQNHKHNPPQEVRVIRYNPSISYPLSTFPVDAVAPVPSLDPPPPNSIVRDMLIGEVFDDPTLLTARYWLSIKDTELKRIGKIDRSLIIWELIRSLRANGFDQEAVFQLIHFSAVNKFRSRPNQLWREILKAG